MRRTVRISEAQWIDQNGLTKGYAMTLVKGDKTLTVYTGAELRSLFAEYRREFEDPEIWDKEDGDLFCYLTEILERSLSSLDFIPVEVSHGL